MLKKISSANARKQLAAILNHVAFGKDAYVLTRRGEPLAAIVSMDDFKLLQEMEERMDIKDAWKAKNEPGENVSWEELKGELA